MRGVDDDTACSDTLTIACFSSDEQQVDEPSELGGRMVGAFFEGPCFLRRPRGDRKPPKHPGIGERESMRGARNAGENEQKG
jgi:hypothetical protein